LVSCAIFALGTVSDVRCARVLPSQPLGQEGQNMKNETYKHIRVNESTGEKEYFYPQEITCPEVRKMARDLGLEIGKSRLGFRVFDAVMVPCKKVEQDEKGIQVFVETSEEEQREIYLELIKDEMNAQEDIKQDGRCSIPDGKGGLKRCPCRMPNPGYSPDNGQPKTLPVECKGCRYEPFKATHTTIQFSYERTMAKNDPPMAIRKYEGERYLRLQKGFVNYVWEREPELADLAYLLTQEYSKSEIAKMTDNPRTTIVSRAKKLMELACEYLDDTAVL